MNLKTFASAAVFGTLGLLIPIHSHAFGLGKIEVYSALNEPFKAQIPVMALRDSDRETLQVQLASAQEFEKAGIVRNYLLTQLKFKVKQEKGKTFITVTSDSPVREPFLDFLIIANTETGRLIREYTALLDPPKTVSSQFNAPYGAAQQAVATTPKPNQQQNMSAAGSNTETVASTWTSRQYQVKNSDTLLGIARKTKPAASVSLNQMMMALLRKNRQAFINENINQLKAGVTLIIPDLNEVTAMSKQQARAAVAAQYEAWKKRHRNRMTVTPGETGTDNNSPANVGAVAKNNHEQEKARLQLVVPTEDNTTSLDEPALMGDKKLAKLEEQLTLAQETIETQKQENDEIKARMKLMEAQIQTLKRLISLNSPELAQMQQALQETPEQSSSDTMPPENTSPLEPAVSDVSESAVTDSSEALATSETVQPENDLPLEPTVSDVSELAVVDSSEALATSETAQPENDLLLEPAASDTSELAVGDSSEVLAMSEVEESPIQPYVATPQGEDRVSSEQQETQEEYYARIMAMNEAAENSALAEDHAAESTPVAEHESSSNKEADIQAENTTDDVTDSEPVLPAEPPVVEASERTESILDKVNTFYAQYRYESLSAGLIALLLLGLLMRRRHKEEDEWEQDEDLVASEVNDEMPAHSDDREQTSAAPVTHSQAAVADTATMTPTVEAGPQTVEPAGEEAAVLAAYEENIEDNAASELQAETVSLPAEEDKLDIAEINETDTKADTASSDELAFSLDLDDKDKPRTDEAEKEPADDLLDYDFSTLSASEDNTDESSSPAEQLDIDDTLTLDIDNESDTDVQLPVEPESNVSTEDGTVQDIEQLDDDVDLDLGDFDDIDEAETKLDLAVAYIDMGDPEGARSILEEVVHEGNADQAGRAKKLLDEIEQGA